MPSASCPIDFDGIAARLGPVAVRHRLRAGSSAGRRWRDRPGRRFRVVSTAMRSPSTGVFVGLLCLKHAAAARGERGGNHHCDAEMLLCLVIVGPTGPARRSAALASTPRVPAIWTERARGSDSGTLLSLAMAREQLACLGLLALLDQRHGGHFAGAAEPRHCRASPAAEPRDHLAAAGAGRIRAPSAG